MQAHSVVEHMEPALESQRKSYKNALKALESGQREAFKQLAATLNNYPLYPYLQYFEYKQDIDKVVPEDIRAFIDNNQDSPISWQLRHHWLKNLADKRSWSTFLDTYRPTKNPALQCYYYLAQYHEGNQQAAFKGARSLWLVGYSQDQACDPLFKAWIDSGQLTPALALQRAGMAINNNKFRLANYLDRFVDARGKEVIRAWKKLYRNPELLKNMESYTGLGDAIQPAILTGFKRLVRKNQELALKLWPQYEVRFPFTTQEKADIYARFAITLASTNNPQAEYWLTHAILYPDSSRLLQQGVRHSLRNQNWKRAQIWLYLLSKTEKSSRYWRYWNARTRQSLARHEITPWKQSNQNNLDSKFDDNAHNSPDPLSTHKNFIKNLHDPEQVQALFPGSIQRSLIQGPAPLKTFEQLSIERSFYGFISSQRLNKPLTLNINPGQITNAELKQTEQIPALKRMRELYFASQPNLARKEWYYTIYKLTPAERSAVAQLTHTWEWHNHAIVAASKSTIRDNLNIRFPTAYKDSISRFSEKEGLDSSWVYSMIRQESAFNTRARSPVGAMGIMQLMPGTAKQVSRTQGLKYQGPLSLLEPDHNIRLGTAYLKQVLTRFNGNMILATAAYNAGPRRAQRWQPKHKPMEGDIWIETIPFKETREYVKNVLTYQAIYDHRLTGGKTTPEVAWLTIEPQEPLEPKTSPVVISLRDSNKLLPGNF